MRRGHCIHFTGTLNEACEAGVRYDSFGPLERRSCRMPCIQEYQTGEEQGGKIVRVWKPWRREPGEQMECSKFQMPTLEQIAEGEADMQRRMDRMRLVMTEVTKWKTWSNKNRVGKQGVIECPACNGRLHLYQAALNGHVWGQCETPDCVSWMQ